MDFKFIHEGVDISKDIKTIHIHAFSIVENTFLNSLPLNVENIIIDKIHNCEKVPLNRVFNRLPFMLKTLTINDKNIAREIRSITLPYTCALFDTMDGKIELVPFTCILNKTDGYDRHYCKSGFDKQTGCLCLHSNYTYDWFDEIKP